MSEQWAIAIMSVGFGAMSAILAWMAAALWGIHKDLRTFVTHDDCNRRMGDHCAEIDEIWKKVRENEKEISALNTVAEIFHKK